MCVCIVFGSEVATLVFCMSFLVNSNGVYCNLHDHIAFGFHSTLVTSGWLNNYDDY